MFPSVTRRSFPGIRFKGAEKALFILVSMLDHQLFYRKIGFNKLIAEVLQANLM